MFILSWGDVIIGLCGLRDLGRNESEYVKKKINKNYIYIFSYQFKLNFILMYNFYRYICN